MIASDANPNNDCDESAEECTCNCSHCSEVRQLREEVSELREELEEHQEFSAQDRAEIRQDTESVREMAQDAQETAEGASNPEGNRGEQTDAQPSETALEDLISLPDRIATEQLSENERRALEVGQKLDQITTKAPAGRILDASAIKEVIEEHHTETVSRVRDYLREFGGESVDQVKRHGKLLLAFDETLVSRISRVIDTEGTTG